MNIFYLHKNPSISASAMTDKHIVKMILESAQLLCTAHHILAPNTVDDILYKPTHINHPSAVWVRPDRSNYVWLYVHFVSLCNEYQKRYGKVHSTERRLMNRLSWLPENIPAVEFTQPPCAMPDLYKISEDHVQCYRHYYIHEKIKNEKDKKRFIEELFIKEN